MTVNVSLPPTVTIATTGTQGPPGPAGPKGDTGPQGPAGTSGGSSVRTASVRITDDNLSGLPSAPAWTIVQTSAGTPLKCSIAATAGDRVQLAAAFMYSGGHYLDWALLDTSGNPALYAASGTAAPLGEGNPTMYPSTSFSKLTSLDMFTVQATNLTGGLATIALYHQGTSAGLVYAHPLYPWRLTLQNIGPEPT